MTYRLLSYATGKGARAGILVGDRVYDAGSSVLALLQDWPAAKSALESVALGLLQEHLTHCVSEAIVEGGETADAKVREASAAIARLVRS